MYNRTPSRELGCGSAWCRLLVARYEVNPRGWVLIMVSSRVRAQPLQVSSTHAQASKATTARAAVECMYTRARSSYPPRGNPRSRTSPHPDPQLFFTIQYGTPFSVPYPTTSTAWFTALPQPGSPCQCIHTMIRKRNHTCNIITRITVSRRTRL
jgi:hypothetical protein